jgi:formate dehydrogenase subunit delta
MSDTELQHLVAMANDIARNFAFQPDTQEQVANHLARYWAPSMRKRIIAHVEGGGQGLSEAALEGVKRLAL